MKSILRTCAAAAGLCLSLGAAAYDTVTKGQMYCGPIDVLGTGFAACYNPIRDAGGKVIGLSYIGHKK